MKNMDIAVTKQTTNSATASTVLAIAKAIGVAIAVTIVDESSVLKTFGRMDGVVLMVSELWR